MPGFSFLSTLMMGVGAWIARSLSNRVVAGGIVGGLVLTATGVAVDTDWLTRAGVLVAALFLGIGVGRVIPARPASISVLLVVLSVADIIWIVSGGGSAAGRTDQVLNFSVRIGTAFSSIGTVDLMLAAAVATHWLRRDARMWQAAMAAPIGMIISNVFVAVSGVDNLPLVPFIALGWLILEAWYRRLPVPHSADDTG